MQKDPQATYKDNAKIENLNELKNDSFLDEKETEREEEIEINHRNALPRSSTTTTDGANAKVKSEILTKSGNTPSAHTPTNTIGGKSISPSPVLPLPQDQNTG